MGDERQDGHDRPLRIGLIAPQTGPYQAVGTELVNGFQLFLQLHGQQLGRHPVTLLTADEGETAESGRAAVTSLIRQGVTALTGVVSPTVMIALREPVEQSRIPLVGSNASPRQLQGVFYIWRTSYVLDEPGRALGRYLSQQLPSGTRLVMIAPDGVDRDAVDGFRAGFGTSDPRLTGDVVWTTPTSNPRRTTYASDIAQVLRREPDAVFCHYSGATAVQFIKQLRAAGYAKDIYGPGFLTESPVLDQLKPAEALGIQTVLNYSADLSNAANRRFASAYRKIYNVSPTTYAMASYDAAQVLDKAIRASGNEVTPQQVNLALGKIGQIDSPRGPWQFNQSRTPQQKWYLRRVQRDGRLLSNALVSELATLG